MKAKKNISDLAQSIEKGAQNALKKSEEFISISKLKLEINSKEDYIREIFSEIGEKIYRRYENGKFNDKDFDSYFRRIKETKKEIKKLNKEVIAVKNKRYCRSCGSIILNDDKYCPECGIKQ